MPLQETVDWEAVQQATQTLQNIKIVITGFRDQALENQIRQAGGVIGTSVTSKTDMVIVKNINETTSKAMEARAKNIQLITVEDFKAIL